jgi:MFS family permease
MLYTHIGPGAPIWLIVSMSLAQGFFNSLQFTSMNSLSYADIADEDASKASSITSTAVRLSFSFGIAFASLVAGWFLRGLNQTDPAEIVPALHQAFVVLGLITMVSSAAFWWLHDHDGNNVSNRKSAAAIRRTPASRSGRPAPSPGEPNHGQQDNLV